MNLKSLLKGFEYTVYGDENIEISGICNDSRNAKRGDVFFCICGFETDGHKYAHSAVEKGAVCLVVTRRLDLDVTQVLVRDDRQAMACIAAEFYQRPADKLNIVGVTGTNGKTTIVYMIEAILRHSGIKTGVIGTIANKIGDRVLSTERTTPESLDLQALLAQMVENGVQTLIMEVSSHSLELKRVYGIEFDVGIFTNLTQDHLDFHHNFENYAQAKRMLMGASKSCVINADDSYAQFMREAAAGKTLSCSIKDAGADLYATEIQNSDKGVAYLLNGKYEINLPISGLFTVYNSMCAIGACLCMGMGWQNILEGVKNIKGIPGRFEQLDTRGGDYSIILDYAHTPDGLENILQTARQFAQGRVVCIFGCGGNRDNKKRPIMAAISHKYADFTIITSDNPRFEEPMDIIEEIKTGIEDSYIVIEDRRAAIKYAIEHHQSEDIIILAGKGHEDYQEIRGVKHSFDEKTVVQELLDERS